MLEQLVSKILTKYLKEYFGTVDKSQLSLDAMKGDFQFSNLSLLPTALSQHGIPLIIQKGIVNNVKMVFPWKKLKKEAVIINASGIYIYAKVDGSILLNHDLKSVASPIIISEDSPRPTKEQNNSNWQKIINSIIDNIIVNIENLSLRIDVLQNESIISFGLTFPRLTINTVDAQNHVLGLVQHPDILFKRLLLEKIAFFVDIDGDPVDMSTFELSMLQHINNIPHQYILPPVTISTILKYNRKATDEYQSQISFSIPDLRFVFDLVQTHSLHQLNQQFIRFTHQRKYVYCIRPAILDRLENIDSYIPSEVSESYQNLNQEENKTSKKNPNQTTQQIPNSKQNQKSDENSRNSYIAKKFFNNTKAFGKNFVSALNLSNLPSSNTPSSNTSSSNAPSSNTPSSNTPSSNTPSSNTPSLNKPALVNDTNEDVSETSETSETSVNLSDSNNALNINVSNIWNFAFRCAQVKRMPHVFKPKLALDILKHRKEYVSLYKQIRKIPVAKKVIAPKSAMKKLQKSIGLEASIFLQEYANTVVSKETNNNDENSISQNEIKESLKELDESSELFLSLKSISFSAKLPKISFEFVSKEKTLVNFIINDLTSEIKNFGHNLSGQFQITNLTLESYFGNQKRSLFKCNHPFFNK